MWPSEPRGIYTATAVRSGLLAAREMHGRDLGRREIIVTIDYKQRACIIEASFDRRRPFGSVRGRGRRSATQSKV